MVCYSIIESEKTVFHYSNVTHGSTNNYQITLTFMKNEGNPLNNTEMMKVDEHTLVFISVGLSNYYGSS